MERASILNTAPRILSAAERAFYFERGYLHLEAAIAPDWLARLRAATDELVERSRQLTASDDFFVIENGHRPDRPRLRRIQALPDQHPTFWAFTTESVLPDIVADLIGPNLTYRDSMINTKWADGGSRVDWHQDLPFYPHTNRDSIQTLVCLEDVTPDQGPLVVVPGSQDGPIYEHFDEADNWTGCIAPRDLETASLDRAVELPGPAGTVVILSSTIVHSSQPNRSERVRSLVINGYSAADALPYTAPTNRDSRSGTLVRGERPHYAHVEPVAVRLPPDWSGGYQSIFEHQTGEQRTA